MSRAQPAVDCRKGDGQIFMFEENQDGNRLAFVRDVCIVKLTIPVSVASQQEARIGPLLR